MKVNSVDKNKGIYVFQLDEKNYINFCPKRGGLVTNWVSGGNEILYFDEKRFIDKTKSIRGGIPILFPICGNLDIPNSLFGKNESSRLTIYRLSKESNLPYPTAKRFWNEYNLDEWIEKFEENPNNLKIFLHQELAESLVYAGKK